MNEAAYEALDNHWPFSDLESRLVRYWGDDEYIMLNVVLPQAIEALTS